MTTSLQLNILDSKRKAHFQKLAAFKKNGYLGGGTALALQLGHRISHDLDIFLSKPLSLNIVHQISKIFPLWKTLVNSSDELTFLTKDKVKLSFIFYPFKLQAFLKKDRVLPLPLLSPEGIALTKAYALSRRNSWRDYVDLYFILKNKFTSLSQIIRQSKKIYGESFSEKLFLAQLLYT
ncbi:hypothetical protein COX69_01645, partial [Candidatus Falkowbacteria bacterium CG_4_10_14_0_2_um_filter_48_10]